MKGQIKKCVITRYDETIKKPPYLTLPLDSVDVPEPISDHLGEEFAERLRCACKMKGYIFKFYCISENKEFDYELVVH